MKRILKIAGIVLLWVFSFAGAGYCAAVSVFMERFMPGVTVNGTDVSWQKIDDVIAELEEERPTEFRLTERDGRTYEILLSDIVLNTEAADFGTAQKNAAEEWFFHIEDPGKFKNADVWSVDNDILEKRIIGVLAPDERDEPADAYLDTEKMQVVPEKEGDAVITDTAVDIVKSSIRENVFSAKLDDSCYKHPEVYSDNGEFEAILISYDMLTDRTLPVSISENITDQITPSMLKEWITYDGKDFVFDDGKIKEYSDELCEKYTTAGKLRDFKTSYGTVVQVGNGYYDNYKGWTADADATYESISEAVHGREESAEMSFAEQGYTLDENGDDIGGTYIEISIDNQHLFFYKNHERILETDIVSGTETNYERATVRGLFHVLQMSSPYVMHGSYGSQPCDYFIRITWMGHAMHDAPWQASFGGTRYIYHGSHGCINMPYGAVSRLWSQLCSLDDWRVPIIIY